jgi:hypothetical protein
MTPVEADNSPRQCSARIVLGSVTQPCVIVVDGGAQTVTRAIAGSSRHVGHQRAQAKSDAHCACTDLIMHQVRAGRSFRHIQITSDHSES